MKNNKSYGSIFGIQKREGFFLKKRKNSSPSQDNLLQQIPYNYFASIHWNNWSGKGEDRLQSVTLKELEEK